MSVRIQFDHPEIRCYTNLDFVTGRVIAVFPNDTTISAVTVKLEAESRTRLAGPKSPYHDRSDKKKTEFEFHKLLYKVLTVFPTPDIQQGSTSSQYTLLAGQYVYPFSFKFPFNNDCSENTSLLRDLKVGQLNLQLSPDMNKHVKKTLPPSLSGFPGEAEIKYFVKATVVKPKFYQENLRHVVDLKFLPIEPPRPPDRHEETFARRKQQFQRYPGPPQKKGLFRKSSAITGGAEEEPPIFQVDARLPSPAIITCSEPLPMRILVQKLNDSSATVYLNTLQIELVGYTHVRAHDLTRVEKVSWTLVSQADLNMPLNNPVDKTRKEWKLPSRLWDQVPLPNTIAPSFETCNISRRYELEIRVGLAHGMASGMRPELVVLPLHFPVQVYSGIAPPPQLLRAMAAQGRVYMPSSPLFPHLPSDMAASASTSNSPITPIQETHQIPARTGSYHPPSAEEPEDAPPSYEDAMAEDIGPVDGPRRDYSVPATPGPESPAFNSDSKGNGLTRQMSERLFSPNASSGPDRRISMPADIRDAVSEDRDGSEPNNDETDDRRPSRLTRALSNGKG